MGRQGDLTPKSAELSFPGLVLTYEDCRDFPVSQRQTSPCHPCPAVSSLPAANSVRLNLLIAVLAVVLAGQKPD
jgi:hypothetical protein